MNSVKTISLIFVIALTLNACGGSKKAQTKKYHRLATAAVTTSTEIKPLTLVVKRPSALSILGGRPMVATQNDDSLVQLSHNFWLESPKVLLRDQIKQWAEKHWQAVSYQTPADGEYQVLETRILAFEKKQNQAILRLDFHLFDVDNKLLFNQQFNVTEQITESTFQAFAKAMSRAIDSTFKQLQSQLPREN